LLSAKPVFELLPEGAPSVKEKLKRAPGDLIMEPFKFFQQSRCFTLDDYGWF